MLVYVALERLLFDSLNALVKVPVGVEDEESEIVILGCFCRQYGKHVSPTYNKPRTNFLPCTFKPRLHFTHKFKIWASQFQYFVFL